MITKLTKERSWTRDGTMDSIRYHLFVSGRNGEGFGELKRYYGNNDFLLSCLQMEINEGIVVLQGFFPNGYCNYPNNPTRRDILKMRRGLGSILLEKIIKDAQELFFAKALIAPHCSDYASDFLQKKGFVKKDVLYLPLAFNVPQTEDKFCRLTT